MGNTHTVFCRASDIRRIKISCRCGQVSVVEIPQQVARALHLHPCPGCSAAYSITQQADKKWKIERVTESLDTTVMQEAPVIEDGQGPNGTASGGEDEVWNKKKQKVN